MNAEEGLARVIAQEGLVTEILVVLTHNGTDPLILTSLCYLANRLLS